MSKFDLWKSARTLRYHSETMIGQPQNVADHSWGVARILLEFWPDSSVKLVKACLDHDLVESALGDIPAPCKTRHPEIRAAFSKAEQQLEKEWGIHHGDLTPLEVSRMKMADLVESACYIRFQIDLGNNTFREPLRCITSLLQRHFLNGFFTEEERHQTWAFLAEHGVEV